MGNPTRFWDWTAERYSRKPVPDEAVYRKKLDITRGYLTPGTEVLEFGCGTGSTALAHAPHVKHVRAVDFSANMLAIARRKAETGGIDNVTFEQCAFDDLEVADESVDVVLGLSILHLLDDRDVGIARVHEMLKPGGIFVSSTACIGDDMACFRFIAPIGHWLGVLPLVRIFTVAELVASLERAGFSIEHEWRPGKNKGVFIVARKGEEDQPVQ